VAAVVVAAAVEAVAVKAALSGALIVNLDPENV
jgi:hypothetical protein